MQLWRHITGAIASLTIWLWAITFGPLVTERYGVDPEDIGVLWGLIEACLTAFALGIAKRIPLLMAFAIYVEEAWRTSVGPKLQEKAARMAYPGFMNRTYGTIAFLLHWFFLELYFSYRALDQEVRRVAPFIFNLAAFILTCCCWALGLFFVLYGDWPWVPKPDIMLQPGPLVWTDQDTIKPYFQRAVLVNRVRWRYTVDGQVVKFQHWSLN